jgi:O-antigen ligase
MTNFFSEAKTPALVWVVATIWSFEVYRYGGVLDSDTLAAAAALGITGILWWATTRSSPPLSAKLWIPIVLLPLYLTFQCLPLPISFLRILSPARAELAQAMAPLFGSPTFAALSASPAPTIDQLIRVIAYAIVFLLIREATADSRRRIWLVVVPLIVVGGVEAAFGLRQFASSSDLDVARGTFINRNHFAGLLAMLVPFAAIFALDLWGRRHTRFAAAMRVASGLAAGVMMLAILQSVSRMGFVAMSGSLLAMLILFCMVELSPRRRWLVPGGAMLAVALLAFVLPIRPVIDRLLQSGAEGSSLTRIEIWKSAINLWQHYPVFGSGAGSFNSAVYRYEPSSMNYTPDFAHNDYLQGLAELGIVGFVIPASFLATMLTLALTSARYSDSRTVRLAALACFGSLAAILIHSLADFNLYIPSNAMLVAWICGVIAGLPRAS